MFKTDRDGDQSMSGDEFKLAVKEQLGFEMTRAEIDTIEGFLKSKYGRKAIKQPEMEKLLENTTSRQYDQYSAKNALRKVKDKLDQKR